MDKLIHSYDFQDELVKAAGRLATFFEDVRGVKSSSSNVFSDEMMRQHIPDDNHFGVHLIAMGCGEDYGFNKNGDFWPREMLVERHPTFVKNGHFFREHNNRDPKLKIGDVKASAWNAKMGRVELIVHGDKRKAEPEYARAKAGKSSGYSMSCRVPYDKCSCCGNEAKRSSLYCDDLRYHMTQWRPKWSKFAYAENPKGTFFDISDVANPADRTAYQLQYLFSPDEQDMAKAACAIREGFMFSDLQAKLAGVTLPVEVALGCSTDSRRAWLEKLAAEEAYIATAFEPGCTLHDEKFVFLKNAAVYAIDPMALADEQLAVLRTVNPDVLFSEMAKRAAVFPFLPFVSYVTGQTLKQATVDPAYVYASARLLPTMFRDALKKQADTDIESLFDGTSLDKSASDTSAQVQKVMGEMVEKFSVDKSIAKSRILYRCADMPDLAGIGVKSAGSATDDTVKKAETFTQAYAMYKVAFIEAMAQARGNSAVDEPSILLITFPYQV
jgi:hypothetical protein